MEYNEHMYVHMVEVILVHIYNKMRLAKHLMIFLFGERLEDTKLLKLESLGFGIGRLM